MHGNNNDAMYHYETIDAADRDVTALQDFAMEGIFEQTVRIGVSNIFP
jgi:hypothetical protein